MYLQAEATLLPTIGIATGRQAVGLAVGYLTPASSNMGEPRTQVVAVLTNGWTVLLFDHNLQLLWESTVKDRVDLRTYYHRLVAHLLLNLGSFTCLLHHPQLVKWQLQSGPIRFGDRTKGL